MKHKPVSTNLDDFESLLQETSSVLSNGGDTGGSSSPVNLPPKAEVVLNIPVSKSTDLRQPLILNPFG